MDLNNAACPFGHTPLYERDEETIVCPTCTRDLHLPGTYSPVAIVTLDTSRRKSAPTTSD